ncbi:hypothetical protein Q3C19_14140 [Bacteroides sp. ET489]|uniref:hypothetical protein n=1 Tax=Bacteroides sp. ET489 TaxID=3057126 RepID=UPI002673FDE0|nr:hypothetical protein [Bacteroides sp. ET489]MDO3391605.1 hypothetical protein [Bacteroides sp. ET489]
MKKKIITIVCSIIILLIGYFTYFYIQDVNKKSEIKDRNIKFKECYEKVKRDVKIRQLGIPEIIEFEDFDSLQIAVNTKGEAYIDFEVRYIYMKSLDSKYDTVRFNYYINTDGKIEFVRKSD